MDKSKGCLLVSWDATHGDTPIVLVGKKVNGRIEIVNSFTGEEARELHEKLTKCSDILTKEEITAEDFTYEVDPAQKKPETCRERLKREYPDKVTGDGWCYGCPARYGYLPANIPCMYRNNGAADCRACWSRPVKEVKTDES